MTDVEQRAVATEPTLDMVPAADRALFKMAREQAENGSIKEAVDTLERLITRHPDAAVFYVFLADWIGALGQNDQAVIHLQTAVHIAPLWELSSTLLFHALLKQDRTQEAFEEMFRFQSVSHSDDYAGIRNEILIKYHLLLTMQGKKPGAFSASSASPESLNQNYRILSGLDENADMTDAMRDKIRAAYATIKAKGQTHLDNLLKTPFM